MRICCLLLLASASLGWPSPPDAVRYPPRAGKTERLMLFVYTLSADRIVPFLEPGGECVFLVVPICLHDC